MREGQWGGAKEEKYSTVSPPDDNNEFGTSVGGQAGKNDKNFMDLWRKMFGSEEDITEMNKEEI